MSERIRLTVCPACRTAVPANVRACPECGGPVPPTPGQAAPEAVPGASGVGAGGPGAVRPEDLEELLGSLLGGMAGGAPGAAAPTSPTAPLARMMLRQHLGCLVSIALVVFGLPLLVGAIAGDALGGLAVALLIVGVVGLGLTAYLIRLLTAKRR